MIVKTYNTYDFTEYQTTFSRWIDRLDIYYDFEYLLCEADLSNSELEIFTIIKEDDVFIYPYFKLKLYQEPFFDIISPYGYAGPFCTNVALLNLSENIFLDYIKGAGCVTEFVRYHYTTQSNLFFSKQIENILNRKIVLIDLKKQFEEIWTERFSSTNRNVIRKIEKEGYLYQISNSKEDISEFIEMYNLTMQNVSAENYYFFEKKYFYNLFEKLKSKIFLAKVVKGNITYSSAIFFRSGEVLTYYLSARNLNFANVPATNFLLSESIKYGIKNKMSVLNLGGGRTTNEQDSLFKFKCSFNKHTTPFFIGKRVHSQEQYEILIYKYIEENGLELFNKRKHILQFYR